MTTKYYGTLYHCDFDRLLSLTRSEMLVYNALIAYGGKSRSFAGSHKKLSGLCSVSVPSIKRALKKFSDNGWLESETYYQVKRYTLLLSDTENAVQVDHSDDPNLDQGYDLPNQSTVDQSYDPHLDHSDDLPLDHSDDLHVIENNNNLKTLHDMSPQNDEDKIFFSFVERWSNILGWKESATEMLGAWRELVNECSDVNVVVELQVIDSWLMVQHYRETNRIASWRIGWFDRIAYWMKTENAQGGRKSLRLNRVQGYYFNFAVTVDSVPYPPEDERYIENESDLSNHQSMSGQQEQATDSRVTVESTSDDEIDMYSREYILSDATSAVIKLFGGEDEYVAHYRKTWDEQYGKPQGYTEDV